MSKVHQIRNDDNSRIRRIFKEIEASGNKAVLLIVDKDGGLSYAASPFGMAEILGYMDLAKQSMINQYYYPDEFYDEY